VWLGASLHGLSAQRKAEGEGADLDWFSSPHLGKHRKQPDLLTVQWGFLPYLSSS
jgi:hypothetical protein